MKVGRMIRAADEWTRGDMLEALIARDLAVGFEALRCDVTPRPADVEASGRRYWPSVKTWQPTSRKSSIVWKSSGSVSPNPSMTPLLVTILGESSFARRKHFERGEIFGARTNHAA